MGFFFSAEVWLCCRVSDFPLELKIQALILPETHHFSPGKLLVSTWGKSGSYQRAKWLHLCTMIYLRISEGQGETTTNRKNALWGCDTSGWESYIALPRVNISVIFWFYHYMCGGGWKQLNSFVAVIFSILCLFWFKMLALTSDARTGRHPRARGSLYWSLWFAFVLLSSVAVGLVRMGNCSYELLGRVTKFTAIKVKTLFSVVNS